MRLTPRQRAAVELVEQYGDQVTDRTYDAFVRGFLILLTWPLLLIERLGGGRF